MTANEAIGILILDDHAVVREGLRLLIERQPGFEVVAEASSLAEAIDCPAEPDVALVDLVLGDARGADVVRGVHARFPRAALLVLTMIDDLREVTAALSHGASGYILKEAAPSELVDALRKVAQHEEYLQPSLGAALARKSEADERRSTDPAVLTPREQEVVRLVCLGHTNSEIASTLHLSLRTVEAHRAHILQKLGVRTRAELVRHAMDAGLVDLSVP